MQMGCFLHEVQLRTQSALAIATIQHMEPLDQLRPTKQKEGITDAHRIEPAPLEPVFISKAKWMQCGLAKRVQSQLTPRTGPCHPKSQGVPVVSHVFLGTLLSRKSKRNPGEEAESLTQVGMFFLAVF